jgi:nucleotidyltransferase/DNA polymerase involved in DNA repair
VDRWVLHFDMDAFFASVEQLTRPTLRGRPVLVGGRGGRGVVAGASYEARAFGARSAMPMHQARRLVGSPAVVLPPRGAVYGVASRRVMDTVRLMVPVLEQLSFDEAFGEPLELLGASADDVERFCAELRLQVREQTGLVASVGAGSGKQIAKIASELAKPDGVRVIRRADEQALLWRWFGRLRLGLGLSHSQIHLSPPVGDLARHVERREALLNALVQKRVGVVPAPQRTAHQAVGFTKQPLHLVVDRLPST